MPTLRTHRLTRTSLLALALVALLSALLARAQPAQAAGVVGSGTPDSCTEAALDSALAGGGSVTFDCGNSPAPITLTSQIVITADTTIDGANGGNPVTLSGGSTTRLFYVNSDVALTLTNLTVRDGSTPDDNGGAIYNLGTVSILNSKFLSNTAGMPWSGGAIESFGTLNISGTEFAYNSAGNGGVLFPRESTSFTTISGSSFHDNQTTNASNGWGGVALVWNGAQVSVDSTSLVSNTARAGGAIYLTSLSVLTVSNGSSMAFNQATAGKGGALLNNGGQLMLDHVTVLNSQSTLGGGAIENAAGTAILFSDSFEHNEAPRGGAVDNQGTLVMDNNLVYSNTARIGGGLLNETTMTVSNSILYQNGAAVGGGVVNNNYMFMTNTQLTRNTATNNAGAANGGGLWLTGTVRIEGSSAMANSADNGGGMYIASQGVSMNRVTINANTAITNGGGIFSANHGGWSATYLTLSANAAGHDGGGIYNDLLAGAYLNSVLISGNSASHGGGGLFNLSGIFLDQVTVMGNRAGVGGGIHNNYGTVTLYNTTLSGNSADDRGGGIRNDAQAVLLNSTLADNGAVLSGGNLWSIGMVTLTNTILDHSTSGGNCAATLISSQYSISSDNTCTLAGTVKGMNPNGLDPLLSALGDYGGNPLMHLPVHMPKANSPAVDGVAGSNSTPYDERGFHRPQGAGYDIGAVERQPSDVDAIPKLWLPLTVR